MKKTFLIFIVAAIVLSFAACKESPSGNTATSSPAQPTPTADKDNETTEDTGIVTEETIIIPGLSRDYKLVHITDVHVISSYDDEAAEVVDAAVRRTPVFYKSQEASINRWYSLAEESNKHNPDAVILTGDMIDFPSRRNIDVFDQGLSRLNAPYVYCVGNHDWAFDYDYQTQNALKNELPKFQKYITGNDCAYSILDLGEFAIVAINNSTGQVEAKALTGLREAFKLNKPIILAMHIPLCADDYPENTLRAVTTAKWKSYICIGENGIKPNFTTTRFIDTVTAEDSPVVAIMAGHVHFTHKDKITDSINQYIGCCGVEGSYTVFNIKAQ